MSVCYKTNISDLAKGVLWGFKTFQKVIFSISDPTILKQQNVTIY